MEVIPQSADGLPPPGAGSQVVVEEFLEGEEASFFALIDGHACLPLASAQARGP